MKIKMAFASYETFSMKIKMAFASYETLGSESLQPSHYYTLTYCRPFHLISIEFQNINNDQGNPPKKLLLPLRLL
jgi:hypothetical protein